MKTNDGRAIKSIWWNGVNGDERRVPETGQKLIFHTEFHGDHDEDWILLYDTNGKEIERHNARFVASIIWL